MPALPSDKWPSGPNNHQYNTKIHSYARTIIGHERHGHRLSPNGVTPRQTTVGHRAIGRRICRRRNRHLPHRHPNRHQIIAMARCRGRNKRHPIHGPMPHVRPFIPSRLANPRMPPMSQFGMRHSVGARIQSHSHSYALTAPSAPDYLLTDNVFLMQKNEWRGCVPQKMTQPRVIFINVYFAASQRVKQLRVAGGKRCRRIVRLDTPRSLGKQL